MQINGTSQLINFGYSIIVGISLCIVYDIIRIMRKLFNTKLIIVNIEDVIFALFSSFTVFGMMLVNREGRMRAFIIFGIFLGALVFEIVLGKPAVKYLGNFADKFHSYFLFKIKSVYKFIKRSIKSCKAIERLKKIVYNKRS